MSVSLMLNGVVQEGLIGDLVTANQKNINNWTVSGSGNINITYNSNDKSNVIVFDNTGGGSADDVKAMLLDFLGNDWGYSISSSNLDRLMLILDRNPTWGICFLKNSTLTTFTGQGLYVSGTTIHPSSGSMSRCNSLVNDYNNWYNAGSSYDIGNNDYQIFPTLAEMEAMISITKSYSITIPTTGKNIITFEAKTPTGYNASADNIQISYEVGGLAQTDNITIENAVSNDYKTYKVITENVDDEIEITLDLSTFVSSNGIEIDIRNISCYGLG